MNGELQIVLCSVPDMDTAETIADTLVTEQLAACVNIIPGITSVYRWEGAVRKDPELLLLIKTAAHVRPLVEQRVQSLHPYELPEIIAVSIQTGQKDYIKWITDSLKSPD
jgi:periplasmic divalent cation tolerance protein